MNVLFVNDVCFAPAIELDYDEPNAVVEEMDIEFVVADQFVQTVALPVTGVIADAVQQRQPGSSAIEHRTAA